MPRFTSIYLESKVANALLETKLDLKFAEATNPVGRARFNAASVQAAKHLIVSDLSP